MATFENTTRGGFFDGIPIVGDVINVAQQGYNFIKDLTNTDNKRAVAAGKELQESSFGYAKQLQEMAQNYGERMFGEQVAANKAAQALQFAYNSQLSNAGRDAINKRLAGINPVENAASYASNVGIPESGLQSSPAPSVGGSAPSPVHYNTNNSLAYAQFKKDSESAESIRIANVTALDEALARIDRYDAETDKLLSEKKINDEEAKIRQERANRRREIIETELRKNNAEAFKDEETAKIQDSLGKAATKTSEAAEKQANAAVERNEIERVRTAIERYNAQTGRMQVNINAERLVAEIDHLEALADKYSSDAQLGYRELKYFDEAKEAAIENIIADTNLKDSKTINEYRGFIEGVVDDVLSDMVSEQETFEVDKDGKKTTTKGFKGKGKWSRVAKLWRLIKK